VEIIFNKQIYMKSRLLILLTAFMAIGAYCAGQDLKPERGANEAMAYSVFVK
jgi:hypothetical protein